jgi:hypothetical protein
MAKVIEWIIYLLKDPRTRQVRYVGWTSKTPARRLNTHIQAAICKPTTHKAKWVLSLLSIGIRPEIEVIECGLGDGWAQAEMKWIAFYREKGAKLTNATDGGEGVLGYSPTPETRRLISEAGKGRKRSAESVNRSVEGARIANTGRPLSTEHKKSIGDFFRGKKRLPEHMAKTAEKLRGRPFSPEHKANLSIARKKRVTTPETKAKMSAARTPEQWAQSAAHARAAKKLEGRS